MELLRRLFADIGQMDFLTYYIWKSVLLLSIASLIGALVCLYCLEGSLLGQYYFYRCASELSELPKAYILTGIFLTFLSEDRRK